MKNKYILIHGSFGSPFSNWIPWLRKEIELRELDVYTPDFPIGVGYQNYTNWSALLDSYVSAGILKEDTILFAHSIAPVFVCKFLVEKKIKIKKLVCVCGFNNYLGINGEYDAVNKSMYFDNLKEVKNYCEEIICYYTENDPYVKLEAEKEFADAIATKVVVIKDGGHLNAESGYVEFSDLLQYI